MASKDVHSSDQEGIISLLESVLSHFPKTSPVQNVRRNHIKDVQCVQNITKEVKHVGSVKSVKCPFISQNVSRSTTHKHNFRSVLTFNTLF
jgi:hypothetical protein